MRTSTPPRDIHDWRVTGVLIVAIVAPLASLGSLLDNQSQWASAAALDGLLLSPALLAAALATYISWRVRAHPETGWLGVALACLGVQAVTTSALRLVIPDAVHEPNLWPRLAELALVVALIAFIWAARRVPLPVDPLALGLAAGALVGVVRYVAVSGVLPVLPPPPVVKAVLAVLILLGVAALLVVLLKLQHTSRWVRGRLGAAAALLGLGQAYAVATGPFWHGSQLVSVVTDVAASILLCDAALGLLRTAIQSNQAEFERAYTRLQEAEREIREARARNHEISATMAAISSAHRLLATDVRLPAKRRAALYDMVGAEMGRLERLARHQPTDGSRAIDLDGIIDRLVLAQEVRGRQVNWQPSGRRVMASDDDVATVLNTLLDNAAKYGGPSTTVRVHELGEHVEIEVTDTGPGIAPGLPRDRIFDWGVRAGGSPGQGIGLNVARTIAQRQGGDLRLRNSDRQGTTFVVGLPKPAGVVHDAAAPVA